MCGGIHLNTKLQFINGEWTLANQKKTREIINPFNKEVIAIVTEGDASDAKDAISAAKNAFDNGEWPKLPNIERGRIVRRIAELIERDAEELEIGRASCKERVSV